MTLLAVLSGADVSLLLMATSGWNVVAADCVLPSGAVNCVPLTFTLPVITGNLNT